MNITVVYLGQARQAAGVDQETRRLPAAATAADAIRAAADAHGGAMAQLLLDGADVRRNVLVAVNGNTARAPADTILDDGDELTVITALAGG